MALALKALLDLLRAGAHTSEHYVCVTEVRAVAHRALRHPMVRVVHRTRVRGAERLVRFGAVALEPRLEAHPCREAHAHFELKRQVGNVHKIAFVLVSHGKSGSESHYWFAHSTETGTTH